MSAVLLVVELHVTTGTAVFNTQAPGPPAPPLADSDGARGAGRASVLGRGVRVTEIRRLQVGVRVQVTLAASGTAVTRWQAGRPPEPRPAQMAVAL